MLLLQADTFVFTSYPRLCSDTRVTKYTSVMLKKRKKKRAVTMNGTIDVKPAAILPNGSMAGNAPA
jgi:hypothetical protein